MITAEQLEGYFIRINNRNNFLIKEFSEFHPDSYGYAKYWAKHKKRCIEGFWSIDDSKVDVFHNGLNNEHQIDELYSDTNKYDGKWRYITPNLYFYVNMGTILHRSENDPPSAPKRKMKPYLRDLDWEMAYNWLECRGFSGFKGDDEYTCNHQVLKLISGEVLSLKDPNVFNSKGELKTYITPREYLRKLHNKPVGIPLYYNPAKNIMLLGSRELGKSYFVAVGVVLHEYLFDGAKEYTEESIKKPFQVELFVGAALSSKSSDLLKKTKEAMENLPGSWAKGTVDYVPSPFYKQSSGSLAPNNQKNPFRHDYEKKVGDNWTRVGTGSNIKHGIFTVDNAEAAAGTRPSIIIVEETGLLPNALQVAGSNEAAQNEGGWKFGSTFNLGTGGNVEKVQESEILFKDPIGFNMLAFDDIFEGSGKMGFFVPAIYGPSEFKDENGNTDVNKALNHFLSRRELKKKSKDNSALNIELMNYPLIPSEMFLNATGAMFPQAMIKEHLAYILAHPKDFENAAYYGELVFDSKGELSWKSKDQKDLVSEWPIKNNKDKPGVIQIWEMPKRDKHGNVYLNRYIQGTDTYDDDESSTNSLGSTFVLDTWTDRIVCEYTGRRLANDFYEICRKINLYYHSSHNYENNKKGLFMWYDRMNSLYLLADTPAYLKDIMDITISKEGNKSKGTNNGPGVNAHGLRSQLDWMMEPAYGEDDPNILNLHKIRSVGYLRELLSFSKDGNYDRVSAMSMVCILRNQVQKYVHNAQQKIVANRMNDPFFKRYFN
jgi:hypothetical protein